MSSQSPEYYTDPGQDAGRGSHQAKAELNSQWPDNVVQFEEPNDPGNPMNWGSARKWGITAILTGMTFVTTFTSAIFSTSVNATAEEYHASTQIMTLGTSMFLFGFSFGAQWSVE